MGTILSRNCLGTIPCAFEVFEKVLVVQTYCSNVKEAICCHGQNPQFSGSLMHYNVGKVSAHNGA